MLVCRSRVSTSHQSIRTKYTGSSKKHCIQEVLKNQKLSESKYDAKFITDVRSSTIVCQRSYIIAKKQLEAFYRGLSVVINPSVYKK